MPAGQLDQSSLTLVLTIIPYSIESDGTTEVEGLGEEVHGLYKRFNKAIRLEQA